MRLASHDTRSGRDACLPFRPSWGHENYLTCLVLVVRLRGGAGIAQLVECKLPKLDVAGSNPVARSREWLSPPGLLSRVFLYINGTLETRSFLENDIWIES
jgi:hypothetical protein